MKSASRCFDEFGQKITSSASQMDIIGFGVKKHRLRKYLLISIGSSIIATGAIIGSAAVVPSEVPVEKTGRLMRYWISTSIDILLTNAQMVLYAIYFHFLISVQIRYHALNTTLR